MSLSDKIRQLTVMYVNGWINLLQYRYLFCLFMAETNRGEADANNLILEIEGEFAELYEGMIQESEFRFRLANVVQLQTVNVFVQENAPKRPSGSFLNLRVFSATSAA